MRNLAGGPGGVGGRPGYTVEAYPGRPLQRHADDLTLVRQNLNVAYPAWKSETDVLLVSLRFGHTIADGGLAPITNRPFTRELWNLQTGVNYFHTFENDWMAGLMVGVGSPSDRPFQSLDEVAVNLGGFLRTPARNPDDYWMFSLFYSPAGQVNFPLPGVAYQWNPSKKFSLNIGLPFSLHWEFAEGWELDMTYLPLLNINAQLQYKITDRLRWHGGYQFLNEAYFLAGRADRRDRFFLLEQRVLCGIRHDVGDHLSIDGYAGYGFDRRSGDALSPWRPLQNTQRFASFPFLGLNDSLRF